MPKLPKAMLPNQDIDDPTAVAQDVEVPDEEPLKGMQVVENEDGSADVIDAGNDEPDFENFDDNLASILDSRYLGALGQELKDLVDKDVKDREKRDEQYAEGIRRTGLGNDTPGGADFEGASRAVHPMLAKGAVDFASRAIKELFPAGGPCKTQIVGEQTEEKIDRAERKKKYMNWQCTTQIEENRAEIERLLSQVPLGGAQYKRWWWDPELKRPRTEAVFIDNIFTPYGSADFYTSSRVSFKQMISQDEYDRRVRTGLYRETAASKDPGFLGSHDETKAKEASNKVEGVSADNALIYNEDGLRLVWQIEILRREEEDPYVERTAPYVIHLDDSTAEILGYFRNWDENDERYRKKHWISEWPFIPWRGGPAIGLAHLIGSLAAAATGSLRALLDTAHIQNFPGAVKLSGARGAGESKQISPTEVTEIDAPAGTDDIRKVIMPFPFSGPSTVLFQLMEWLTQQSEMVVATASEKIADSSNNMPVGTALALIEQGSTNFSAVHSRLHAALKRDLEILHRLNAENMEDEETVEELGELMVYKADFQGPMDIIPVSDPNIFSEAQRYAQLQAVLQLKSDPQFAQFFKPDQLLARALKLLNVPDIDGIADLPKETKNLTPLEENCAVATNERPLKVYPEQDDLAHLKAHIQFATAPMFGANPLIASGIMAAMLQHCKEHLIALYKKHAKAATAQVMAVTKAQTGKEMPEEQAQLYGAAFADQLLHQFLTPMVLPGLESMQKIVSDIAQSSAPKPSPDVMLMENNRKEIEIAKITSKKDADAQQLAVKQMLDAQQEKRDTADRASQERLAQLATSVELLRDQNKQGSEMMMAEFEARQQKNMLVLQTVLEAAVASAAGAGGAKTTMVMPNGMDMAKDLLTPMLGGLSQTLQESITGMTAANSPMSSAIAGLTQQQQNFQRMLQEQQQQNNQAFTVLAQGLQAVYQTAGQQYHAELFTGPDGVRRARRVPVQPEQQQLAPPDPSQQAPAPQGQMP